MHYRNEINIGIIRLTVLSSIAPDPFCRLLADELQQLCEKLFLTVPTVPTTIRRCDGGQFLLPQALEMMNSLINGADQLYDYRELAFDLRQIKRRVILKHTASFKETRAMLAGIIDNIPKTGVLDGEEA